VKRATAVAGIVLGFVCASTSARADDSTRGPAYVQGTVGINFWDFPGLPFIGDYSWTGFDPTIEFGFHFSGKHQGLSLGIRQSFIITASNILGGHAAGTTVGRGGYDFAFKAGSMEVNVDPFLTIGAGYVFDGPHAGLQMSTGLDVKLFLTGGFYLVARPVELGFQCLHDSGRCAFAYLAGVGAGFAFGN